MKKSKIFLILSTIVIVFFVAYFFIIPDIPFLNSASNKKGSGLSNNVVSYSDTTQLPNIISITSKINSEDSIKLSTLIDQTNLPTKIPNFITINNNNILIKADKYSQGDYKIDFPNTDGTTTRYDINVVLNDIDITKTTAAVKSIIGNKSKDFGVYFYDLLRHKEFDINGGKIYEPASMAKIATATLIMRDIDAGKYTLQTTYLKKNSEMFSTLGDIGSLPNGTPVTIDKYLQALLIQSDNNAWYALNHFLGGNYEVVNPRIINELGVNPLFLDPPQGTSINLGNVFKGIYNNTLVSKKSADYILGLLENAVPSMRAGLGLGVPSDIKFANKIGTLDAPPKLGYEDSVIIYGKNTDYVLVVMDQNTDWKTGEDMLKDISAEVYKDVDL